MITEADRARRRRLVYGVGLSVTGVAVLWLVWGLRSLIAPCVIGALLAYLSTPALRSLMRAGLPRGVAVMVLFGSVVGAVALLVLSVRSTVPDEIGRIELEVQARARLHDRYQEIMGIDGPAGGNLIYSLMGRDADPVKRRIDAFLRLSAEEQRKLELAHASGRVDDRIWRYHLRSARRDGDEPAVVSAAPEDTLAPNAPGATTATSVIVGVVQVLSLWLAMPFVFLFLLVDDGRLKRWVVGLMPNRYFELALTTIDMVDDAIGRYLRGTLLECGLVGLTFVVCLSAVGVDAGWAVVIGLVAGLANAIPFLGPGIGLLVGLAYAVIADEVHPWLPWLGPEHLVVGVIVTVGIAQLLDNTVFQPIVLGSAVNLHPLAVVLGVMGGSILFGVAGMLFAVPTLVITNVVVGTTMRELRAYRLI